MDKNELARMSGEHVYRRPKAMVLNQIKINGDTGKFVKVFLAEEKDTDGKYKTKDLGDSIDVVFLKIRRQLAEKFNPRVQTRQTTEHNGVNDRVMMFGPDSQQGIAKELREKFPDLRTVQIVYCIEKSTGETVRLMVKGASLGSENKAKETNSFYDYLQSFAKDEHSYEYITNITSVEEKGQKTYYCMNFNKGAKLSDSQMEKVGEAMKIIHENIEQQDAYYNTKTETEIKKAVNSEETPIIEYPEEESNTEDIPF